MAEGETHKYEDSPFYRQEELGARGDDGVKFRFPESVDLPSLTG